MFQKLNLQDLNSTKLTILLSSIMEKLLKLALLNIKINLLFSLVLALLDNSSDLLTRIITAKIEKVADKVEEPAK